MNTWFRKVGMGAVALTLAGVLGGCNNGNGGSSLLRLYFGINGSGSCNSVVVDVNLDDADAIIARDEFGDVQCSINPALDSQGCDISFSELPNGDLRAIIDDCTIPAVTNLFSCLFEDVDISELQQTATAQCSCTTESCDGTPPVCISLDPDPRSCEDCDNGVDDDGNGLVDCDDPNCANAPECSGTTTTSTTSTTGTLDTTTTSTSTSTTASTTTTTLPPEFVWFIRFGVDYEGSIGALQFQIDGSNAPGEWAKTDITIGIPPVTVTVPVCSTLVEDVIEAYAFEDEAQTIANAGLASIPGFKGPGDVIECQFVGPIKPVAGDFMVTTLEAARPDQSSIFPLPDVVVTSIVGDIPDTTTTTTVPKDTTTTVPKDTTTTLPPDTTTTTKPGPTTTTMPGGDANYRVTYTLTDRSGDMGVGALQWVTDYSGAPGDGFAGSGGAVACTAGAGVPGSLFAPNDVDATQMLTIGVVSFSGFNPVAELANCTFNGNSATPPVPGDFPFTIEDATDVGGAPITATISVTVTEIP